MAVQLLLPLLLLASVLRPDPAFGSTFEWNGQPDQPFQWQRSLSLSSAAVCVDIPANLTLCHGISYNKMRLPNLLNHDTLTEATQQSASWVPLEQLNCHPDTKLFLCSLFSPVCLDQLIPPCRSLCLSVQNACEQVMLKFGYPWPKIVNCLQFPVDNDMCIMAQHGTPTPDRQEKGRRRKGNKGKKQQQQQQQDNSNRRRGPNKELVKVPVQTVFEPQPGHLHQHPLEARLHHHQPPVDLVNSRQTGSERNGGSQQHGHKQGHRQLYNEIVSKWCDSQWIVKARLYQPTHHQKQVKLRNYQLLQGNIHNPRTPLLMLVDSNVLAALNQTTADGPQQTPARRRFFIMGSQAQDGQLSANFGMVWPHKSSQLRKALKSIKNGSVRCPSRQETTTTTTTTTTTMATTTTTTTKQPETSSKTGRGRNRERKERRKQAKEQRSRK